MTLVLMFPGQSSRYPGMVPKLAALSPSNRELLERASELLGRDLHALYQADNAAAYACNQSIQIGMFVVNHMFLQLFEAAGLRARASAGLSLGEYNHLVHIGALSFEQALRAVEERGAAYDAGPRGAMASVFPLPLEELQAVVDQVRGDDCLEVVNLNSPQQNVISGHRDAVERAVKVLEDEHYLQPEVIEKQVPMHASMFRPVGERLRTYLATVKFAQPKLPYLPNRLAELIAEPAPAQLVELLSTHVHEPVLWQRSIDLVIETWPDTILVEVGPRKVLCNLLRGKWHRRTRRYHLDHKEDIGRHLEQVLAELQAAESEARDVV